MKKNILMLCMSILFTIACGEKFQTPPPAPPPPPLPPQEETPGSGDEEQDPEIPFKDVTLAGEFKEDFSERSSGFFRFAPKANGEDFRYFSGHPSLSSTNTKILMMCCSPTDGEGWGKGPQVTTKDYTFYGSYSARIRIPDIKKAQKNIGAIAGLYVYDEDPEYGRSEIDIELRLADPTIIYLSAYTGKGDELNRISRTINLAKGTVIDCSYGIGETETGTFTNAQNSPDKIAAISNFNASQAFYIYGFDWYPDRITWWMMDTGKTEKIILWDYEGQDIFPGSTAPTGIPVLPAYCISSFWHSKSRLADKLPSAKEAPKYPFELEIDWISYEPFNDLNDEWNEKGKENQNK